MDDIFILNPGICFFCNKFLGPFNTNPLMESEDGLAYHEVCESCANED